MKTIESLIRAGVLKIARMPEGNPQQWERGGMKAVLLIGQDYQALTPKFWNPVYQSLDWPIRVIALVGDPRETKNILKIFQEDKNCIGVAVGVGFKDEVVSQGVLDELDPITAQMRTVNVVVKRDNRLVGYNTDGVGYFRSFQEKLLEMGRIMSPLRILLLGAGGSASAIAFALARRARSIVILNRSVEKAVDLADQVNSYMGFKIARAGGENEIPIVAPEVDVIINTTLKGATGQWREYAALSDTSSLERNLEQSRNVLKLLSPQTLISDINLTKGDSTTIRIAKEYNLPTLDGQGMFFHQAIEAFCIVNHSRLQREGISKQQIAAIMRQQMI